MKTKSALPWFGSDSEVAPDLASLLDHCNHVTIPFVGGAGIIPHLKARAIVANDIHEAALNFFRHMSNHETRDELIHLCENTLSHPSELEQAQIILSQYNATPIHAWAFWAVCWIGRKGKGGTKHQGGMPSVRRTGKGGTNASRLVAAASDLYEWAKHFRRCEWEQKDFRDLLPQVADQPGCGIYCDPPWFGAGRNYLHNFTDDDHADLRSLLERFQQATIVVRYGCHELASSLYAGWKSIQVESRTQSNANVKEVWFVRTGA